MIPRRVKRQSGRHALVDGIPFVLPVNSDRTSALMAAFEIDTAKDRALAEGFCQASDFEVGFQA